MILWKYKIVSGYRLLELEIELNRLGKEGWEAVSMATSSLNGSGSALVKRGYDENTKQWI